MGVAIGIDSHKGSLAVAAVDELGRTIEARECANDPAGHGTLLRWVTRLGGARVIGVEGSATYGAGVVRVLLEAGEDVSEVPPFLTHRERKKTPAKGKSDVSDAEAIARVVARGNGLAPSARDGVMVDLKLLSDHRDELVCARTRAANRAHKHLVVARPGYGARIPRLTTKAQRRAARALLRGDRSVRANVIRTHLDELERLGRAIAAVTHQLAAKIAQSGTTLTSLKGIGVVTAAKILGEVGDPSRLRSKAAFAMLNATAPLEVASGASARHRLNRGGNRKLNYALHMMALSLCRTDARTKDYVARRRMQGKSKKEAMRCLKRHLSNVVYRELMTPGDKMAA